MNKWIHNYSPVLGRAAISLIFLLSGFGKITDFSGTTGYMASHGMPFPAFLLVGAIVFELVGGLSVLTGTKARWGAAMLIVFLIPASLIFHAFWAMDPESAGAMAVRQQQISFLKNVAILGGLLFIVANGPGPLSIDHKLESKSSS